MNHDQSPFADALLAHAQHNWVRYNTPGHQVSSFAQPELTDFFGERILGLDIQPLVHGIDYGVTPTPLEESLQLAADAWGARRTWFLTNGASMGNLTACLALRNFGDTIVVQRSVHSSVIDGLAITGLQPEFVYPSVDPQLGTANGVTPQALDDALQSTPNAVAAYVVTPSYFGACADVKALADVAHKHGVPLIVDEAWGAHFGFHPGLPQNAIRLGADLVIDSTHKLAGSLTQSAMLHLGNGPFSDALEPLIERAFKSMQSTSASGLLLASLDLARRGLKVHGATTISKSLEAVQQIRDGVKTAGRFLDIAPTLMTYDDVIGTDPLRISLNMQAGAISGHEAREILFNEHRIHCEMSTSSTLVMLIGAGTQPDVERTLAGLHALPRVSGSQAEVLQLPPTGKRRMSVREAYLSQTEVVSAADAIGRVSSDSVAAYPPGIPNLLPGEEISEETVNFLQSTIAQPFGHVRGSATPDLSGFRVVK